MKKFAERGAQNETEEHSDALVWPYIIIIINMIIFLDGCRAERFINNSGTSATSCSTTDNLRQRFRESSTDGRRR
jgi:hypothetical protein